MSVELHPDGVPDDRYARPVGPFARAFRLDPRIPAAVPGFDAPFFQAGLAGYSDGAMRLVARRFGCPYCVTEALLDRTLLAGGKGRRREDPDLIACECGTGDLEDNRAATLDDHPIAGQVIGSDPGEMARAAALLAEMGYDAVDVNLACPVKKIRARARGGHFLAQPDDAIAVLRAVRDAVPPQLPCTVKLRRAFDDAPRMEDSFWRIFDAAYELGYAWATVHCRTVTQRYTGPARWSFLADLVSRRPDRVILGSGDIWSAEDIFGMLQATGVSAVGVARGCIGNPWIFAQARALIAGQPAESPTIAQQREALMEHHRLACVLHGTVSAGQRMRKFGIRFAAHHPNADEVRRAFIDCSTPAQWQAVVERHYAPVPSPACSGA